jgi:murein L,D-transpeptidase YcbB/YkuD
VLHHRPKSLLLTLRFLFCAAFLLSSSVAYAQIIEARVLEQQLSAPAFPIFTKTDIANLQQFYAARKYKPVWLGTGAESPLLEIALTFIANAKNEGLDSQDYQLQQLQQLQQQAPQSLPAAIELELRTTQSLMKLTKDLSRGRLQATAADPDWHIRQSTFEAAAFLHKAIKTDRLQQSLDDLSPKQSSYLSLKQTLMRYQNLINDHTDWIHIPSTPAIRPGNMDTLIPLIRQRILQAYAVDDMAEYRLDSNESLHYDDELVTAVKAFQVQHGLNPDGVIGKNTIRAFNIPLAWKIRQLRINMERLRWLPRNLGKRYILVNTAGFRLTAVEQGVPALNMRIIVGLDYRSTPSFNSAFSHMVLNPSWTVPATIARKDLLPKQQKDPTYFTAAGFKVYSSYARDAEAIDPHTIDWRAIKAGFPYLLRQDPGAQNALGRIKFMFPNSFDIYLHDTPSKSLFQKDIRTFSSGCIRLEKPMELAAFLLNTQQIPDKFRTDMDSGKTVTAHLPRQLPVYLVYSTAWVDEQEKVHFSPDIYGRDLRALQYAGW